MTDTNGFESKISIWTARANFLKFDSFIRYPIFISSAKYFVQLMIFIG